MTTRFILRHRNQVGDVCTKLHRAHDMVPGEDHSDEAEHHQQAAGPPNPIPHPTYRETCFEDSGLHDFRSDFIDSIDNMVAKQTAEASAYDARHFHSRMNARVW